MSMKRKPQHQHAPRRRCQRFAQQLIDASSFHKPLAPVAKGGVTAGRMPSQQANDLVTDGGADATG